MTAGAIAPLAETGFGGMLLPAAILLFTYAVIVSERVNRAVIALIGAGLTVTLGVVGQEDAIASIDFNTIALLTGMMIIVGISKHSGLYGYVAVAASKAMRGSPAGILLALALVTAVLSAFLDNVTTVLLIVPVTLVICSELGVRAYPFIFAQILASNIGGTATLIGDPPNILIGSAVGLTFMDFALELTPIVLVSLTVQTLIMHLLWGRRMTAGAEQRSRIMALSAVAAIQDYRLLYYSLFVVALVVTGFIMARPLGLEAGGIAMFGAALLMFFDNLPRPHDEHTKALHASFGEVEWITIFFFIGLFIIIGGVEHAGILELLAHEMLEFTGGDMRATAIAILWGSAILSAIVDNIPFVATMIPLIMNLAPSMGGEEAIMPLWWALSLGACFGGNGSLVGASANLAAAGVAERGGVTIRFVEFTLYAFPMMLVSVALAHFYVVWRFF